MLDFVRDFDEGKHSSTYRETYPRMTELRCKSQPAQSESL
jgi:hypothetical protein